jgi:hypothetical protein
VDAQSTGQKCRGGAGWVRLICIRGVVGEVFKYLENNFLQ